MNPLALSARGVAKSFGGLAAVDAVDLDLSVNSIHALIGTNGAGKSTLLNLLAGDIAADRGSILLFSKNVTRATQPARARAGIGRTYQRNTLFEALDVTANCEIAAQARKQQPWFVFRAADRCGATRELAASAIEECGLARFANAPVHTLSHGQKRQLEIAMCLAHQPRVLLLDEPLAGMGLDESENILSLLLNLKKSHAILLVEHDMSAVFRVADELTVMVNGKVIASGSPQVIRRSPAVIAAYLGEEHGLV